MKLLFLFAHYDVDGKIDPYVIYYLKQLNALGDVIFISDTDITDKELKKVGKLTVYKQGERHGEYDFGSYKRGFKYALKTGILNNYDYIVLVNDSVYGAFYDLKEPIKYLLKSKPDCWGFTKNTKAMYVHIQSYFVGLSRRIFTSRTFRTFINGVTALEDKHDIVCEYEYKLGKIVSNLNGSMVSVFDDDVAFENDPHFCSVHKLIKEGFPFVKRRRITGGHKPSTDFIELIQTLDGMEYPSELIVNHLLRTERV